MKQKSMTGKTMTTPYMGSSGSGAPMMKVMPPKSTIGTITQHTSGSASASIGANSNKAGRR